MAQIEPTLQEENIKLVIHPYPNPVDAEGMTQQPLNYYTQEDHDTWKILVQRQTKKLKGNICEEFFTGLEKLKFPLDRVPDIKDLSNQLHKISSFRLVCVGGLVSSQTFFKYLANRQFTVGWFVRKPHQLDYLPEPDLFHDLFGHVPLLTNNYYADFMQKVGLVGLQIIDRFKFDQKKLEIMSNALLRLYWFTIEFGLMKPSGKPLCIYGAGIVSSFTEVEHSLFNIEVKKIFIHDISRVVRTKYSIDEMQKLYFVIESFEQLFSMFDKVSLIDEIVQAREQLMFDKNIVITSDKII